MDFQAVGLRRRLTLGENDLGLGVTDLGGCFRFGDGGHLGGFRLSVGAKLDRLGFTGGLKNRRGLGSLGLLHLTLGHVFLNLHVALGLHHLGLHGGLSGGVFEGAALVLRLFLGGVGFFLLLGNLPVGHRLG